MTKVGASEGVQKIVDYAFQLGGKDFVLTLEAENGLWKSDRKSDKVGANGYSDFGLCQLNMEYHEPFIRSQEFNNPYKQIDYCYEVWKKAINQGRIKTTFYGYNRRHVVISNFHLK